MVINIARRKFISALSGITVAWPLAARAQQPKRMRRVGVVIGYAESDPNGQLQVTAFRQQLRNLGWVEGSNIKSIFALLATIPTALGRWQ